MDGYSYHSYSTDEGIEAQVTQLLRVNTWTWLSGSRAHGYLNHKTMLTLLDTQMNEKP